MKVSNSPPRTLFTFADMKAGQVFRLNGTDGRIHIRTTGSVSRNAVELESGMQTQIKPGAGVTPVEGTFYEENAQCN